MTLAWDPSPDPDITKYHVLYGQTSGSYASRVTVGSVTQATVNDLEEGATYYFAVTAENSLGLESLPSNEISYQVPVPVVNEPPVVNAGPDISITLPATASLSGSVTDDGLPATPGSTALTWSMVGGPGTVTFASASSTSTTASFSASGSYILRLTANDGELTASDDINVEVAPNLPPVAVDQSLSVDMNTPLAITLSGSDPNDHAIGYQIMTQPAHGTLSGSAPDVVYTPANNYYGSDSFSFTVSDGYLSSAPAIVSLAVESTLPIVSISASDSVASEPGADTGTFKVSRGGNIEGDVMVEYVISGSALYGTDYEAIPTSITIPAGAASANITLRVWDDDVFEGDEDVTLTLAAGAGYTIGASSTATVVIHDNDAPLISITSTKISQVDGGDRTAGPAINEEQVELHVPGVHGIAYILQYSTNLVDWVNLATNGLGAPMDFIDINTGNFKSRLYRVAFTDGDVSESAIVAAAAAGNTSQNIVGVVNVTAAPGMTLIANQLINTEGNDLNTLLPNVPEGTQYFIIGGGNKYRTYKFEGASRGWWPNGNTALEPGYGAFIRNNSGTNFTVSFVGEVDADGAQAIPRPGSYSIASCPLPVSAEINNILAVSPLDGDQVITYQNGEQGITSAYSASTGIWSPAPPTIQPGESILYLRN